MMRFLLIVAGLVLSGQSVLFGQVPASGDFFLTRQLDDFTDEDRSSIMVASEDLESALAWVCQEGAMYVLLTTGYMIGQDDEVDIMWRVDRNEPSPTIRGPQGSANTAAVLPRHRIYSFTREAMAGTTVVIQVTDPFDRDAERHRYSLMGLTASLRLLSCYNPPDPALLEAGVPEPEVYEWVVDTQERRWVSVTCFGTLTAIPVERRRFFATLTEVFAAGFNPNARFDCQD